MISRQWRGIARPECADEYVAHLRGETFPQLKLIPGFVDAAILRRSSARGVEFVVVTQWQSIDAIRKFAGADVETAVVPERVQVMMVDYDRRVALYEVVD
jgi:heme-degrading monooxygenase HmoA